MTTLRALGKDIIAYGIGDFAMKAVAFLTLPLYTRLLSVADYGVLSTIAAVAAILSSVSNLGLSSAVQRAYYADGNPDHRSGSVSTGLFGLAGWSLLLFAMIALAARPVAEMSFGDASNADNLVLACLAIPFLQFAAYGQDVLRLEFRPWAFTGIGLAIQLLQVGFATMFIVLLGRGLGGYFMGSILAGIVGAALAGMALRRSLRLTFSPTQFREFVGFGLPLAIAGLSAPVFMLADRLILARSAGIETVAIFAVASTMASGMTLLGAAFSRAWSPMVWRMRFEAPDYREKIARVLVYLLAGFAVVAVSLSLFAPELLAVLTPNGYRDAALVVPPLALYMVLNASIQVTALGISLEGRTRYLALLYWLALVLNVGLDLVLVQVWQAVGIAVATLLAELFLTVAMALVGQRLHPLPYHGVKIAVLAALTVPFVALSYVLPGNLSPELFAAKLLVVAVFCACLVGGRVIGLGELRQLLPVLGMEPRIVTKD